MTVSGVSFWLSLFKGSIVEEEDEEGEGEEGAEQSVEDKIKLEQEKLEQDKKALQDNHSMMAEVCIHEPLTISSYLPVKGPTSFPGSSPLPAAILKAE